MEEKIYVGTFEFDKEEKSIIFNALLTYLKILRKLKDKEKYEICKYIIIKFKKLKDLYK